VVEAFWGALDSFTAADKCALLKFVTACSRPPLLGFKYLEPNLCIQVSILSIPNLCIQVGTSHLQAERVLSLWQPFTSACRRARSLLEDCTSHGMFQIPSGNYQSDHKYCLPVFFPHISH
jgi:HECT-domain (ubiquitin-transferase)